MKLVHDHERLNGALTRFAVDGAQSTDGAKLALRGWVTVLGGRPRAEALVQATSLDGDDEFLQEGGVPGDFRCEWFGRVFCDVLHLLLTIGNGPDVDNETVAGDAQPRLGNFPVGDAIGADLDDVEVGMPQHTGLVELDFKEPCPAFKIAL